MTDDLIAARDAMLAGRLSAKDALDRGLALGRDHPHTYIRRFDETARATAMAVDAARAAGAPVPALAGLAVSVKDLFDVQGHPATAGSHSLRDRAAATADCPAVANLRAAGAALTGHTNMTEFAFSGVGINPHHGTPANVATLAFDTSPRIPGGSSSGAAVSVASGEAWAALGSDTGGSIRIPAALQGLVGFKNTARLTSTEGAVPLSTTLDTACAITRSVRDAVLLHQVLANRHVELAGRPASALRLAVALPSLDRMDATVATAFERTLAVLRDAGATIDELDMPLLDELGPMNAGGGFSAAESWAWHRDRLADHEAEYDPRVLTRIRRGEAMSAADYVDLLRARRDWSSRMAASIRRYDAVLGPTVPMIAPTIESLATDEAFYRTNALLLRNPSVVNMLDGCALSLPCHRAGEMPVGLMVWSHAMQDDTVLDASLAIEQALAAVSH